MECGKWQLLSAFLLCCIQLPITFSDQLLRPCARTPPHRCRAPIDNSSTLHSRPVVFVGGRPQFSSCELYVNPDDPSLGTQPCTHGWEYLQDDPDEWTLVTEVKFSTIKSVKIRRWSSFKNIGLILAPNSSFPKSQFWFLVNFWPTITLKKLFYLLISWVTFYIFNFTLVCIDTFLYIIYF